MTSIIRRLIFSIKPNQTARKDCVHEMEFELIDTNFFHQKLYPNKEKACETLLHLALFKFWKQNENLSFNSSNYNIKMVEQSASFLRFQKLCILIRTNNKAPANKILWFSKWPPKMLEGKEMLHWHFSDSLKKPMICVKISEMQWSLTLHLS